MTYYVGYPHIDGGILYDFPTRVVTETTTHYLQGYKWISKPSDGEYHHYLLHEPDTFYSLEEAKLAALQRTKEYIDHMLPSISLVKQQLTSVNPDAAINQLKYDNPELFI